MEEYSTPHTGSAMNQFLNIDCMDGMKQFPDKYFELAIVDPPYGIERFKKCETETSGVYAKKGTFKNASAWNNEKPSPAYFQELFRVSRHQIIWGGNNFELPTSEYFCIWNKEQAMENFAECEFAWVSPSLRKPARIFTYPITKHNRIEKINPAQKPVPLYLWLLNKYAKKGFKILDTHVGSASSLIACESLGFEYVGFELDKKFYDLAVERLSRSRLTSLDIAPVQESFL